MNVLITGANGFIGKNLTAFLQAIKHSGKSFVSGNIIDEIYTVTRNTTEEQLQDYCNRTDFVFHFAGVNRCDTHSCYGENHLFTSELLKVLQKHNPRCPIVFASSVQASLQGRYNDDYGRSKLRAEQAVFEHGNLTGAEVYVYRFPNVFGKWCKPDYNSVVATFCYHIARDEPILNTSPDTLLELLYIDDLLEEMLAALCGKPNRNGAYCYVPKTHQITVGELEQRIRAFAEFTKTLEMVDVADSEFDRKLLSTYISYLPSDRLSIPLRMHTDNRGSFAELFRNCSFGQISINTAKPGMIKGEHWHNSKWELFVVVSGSGRICMRQIGTNVIIKIPVCADKKKAVLVLPGYTHNLENISQTEDLVTVIWANEAFDPNAPDTYYERVSV